MPSAMMSCQIHLQRSRRHHFATKPRRHMSFRFTPKSEKSPNLDNVSVAISRGGNQRGRSILVGSVDIGTLGEKNLACLNPRKPLNDLKRATYLCDVEVPVPDSIDERRRAVDIQSVDRCTGVKQSLGDSSR